MSQLASIIIDEPVDVRPVANRRPKNGVDASVVHEADLLTDLGVWLAGIDSFLAQDGEWRVADSQRRFEIAGAALERCSLMIALELSGRLATTQDEGLIRSRNTVIAAREAARAASCDTQMANPAAAARRILDPLRAEPAFRTLIEGADAAGVRALPEPLRTHAVAGDHPEADLAEAAMLLPRFGRILRWLNVVERMLAADEPLKPALVVFASIHEQVVGLTQAIERRLKRFPEHEAETFAKLDAAAYTASIEVKKVFTRELAAVAGQRQPPSIYARFETAHSLLNDGFQQMLAGLALEFDPTTDVYEMFPAFRLKRERSLELRSRLWALARTVQGTERSPEKKAVAALRAELREFMSGTVAYLFYKDIETFDRFVEEVLAARDNSDLVPILHRFGAYLETLFGQVNLRFVLQDHPFEAP
jgi:hypothetical protein